MPSVSYLMLTGTLAYASASGASGTNRWRGTVRRVVSTAGVRAYPASRIWSTRALRSRSASAPGVAIVSVFTVLTLVVSDVPSAGDAVLSLDPMTASRAVLNRALWSSGRRPARLAWKITWWAMTARSPRESPPSAARWASVAPACSKAATHSACPSSGPSVRPRLRASTVISVRMAGIRAAVRPGVRASAAGRSRAAFAHTSPCSNQSSLAARISELKRRTAVSRRPSRSGPG